MTIRLLGAGPDSGPGKAGISRVNTGGIGKALPSVPPGKTAGQSLNSPWREVLDRHPDTEESTNAAKNASPWLSTSWPACPAMATRTSRRCSASTPGYCSRSALTSRVDPSISVNKNVTAPAGSPLTWHLRSRTPAAARSTATGRPACGTLRSPSPQRTRQSADPARGARLARRRPTPSRHPQPRSNPPRHKPSLRLGQADSTRPARQPRPPPAAVTPGGTLSWIMGA
jgi:hypothetical protein